MMISAVKPSYNQIAFRSREDDDRKRVTTSEVATATGATGAAAAGARTAKNGAFDMFKSSGKVGKVTKETADALKNVRKPIKQVKGIFPKFMQAFRNTKHDVLKWADTVKDSHVLKPLLKSKLFGAVAGAMGVGMGIFVTITGIGDIMNTVSEYVS